MLSLARWHVLLAHASIMGAPLVRLTKLMRACHRSRSSNAPPIHSPNRTSLFLSYYSRVHVLAPYYRHRTLVITIRSVINYLLSSHYIDDTNIVSIHHQCHHQIALAAEVRCNNPVCPSRLRAVDHSARMLKGVPSLTAVPTNDTFGWRGSTQHRNADDGDPARSPPESTGDGNRCYSTPAMT